MMFLPRSIRSLPCDLGHNASTSAGDGVTCLRAAVARACLSMIPRVKPEGMLFRKPVSPFRDHALTWGMRARATILEIQMLRAVAAMAVVVMHIGIELRYWGKATISWTDVGNAGVDLFFVISGFIMVFISWERFGRRDAPVDFFVRRLIRIVPLYWLVPTGYILAGSFPASRIITSYLFVPDFGADAAPLPVVLQGWTLNFEMFFYLVLALALLLPRLAAIATVSTLLATLVLLKVPYYGQSVILEFVLGLWIGWAFRRGLTLPLLARVAAIVAGFAV